MIKKEKETSVTIAIMSALIQPSSLYWIKPLTGDNYSAWKEKMCWILLEQDLWEHASGEAMKPEPANAHKVTDSEKQTIANWMKKDQQAFMAISLRISNNYLVYTYGASMAHGVLLWISLIFHYICTLSDPSSGVPLLRPAS